MENGKTHSDFLFGQTHGQAKNFKHEPGKFVCPGETKRSVFTKTNEPATSAARRQLEQRNKVS